MSGVRQIFLINFVVYAFTYLLQINGLYLNNLVALYPITSEHFSLLQIVTHIFAHVSFSHVLSNMFIFLIVGDDVERKLGKSEFWKFFILSGIFSSGLYFLFSSSPILGSSGAVFSVVAASVLINWKIKLWSVRLRNLLFISLILYEVFLTFSNPDSEVGHLAHVFGSIFGLIYFFKYIKNKS